MPLQLYVLVTVTTVGRRALITADVEAFLRRFLLVEAERFGARSSCLWSVSGGTRAR